MLKDKNFFIFGYPRSRTAWFANLFTTGDVFCYHEIIPFTDNETLRNQLADRQYGKIGVSEPNPMAYDLIAKLYPDSPKVFIFRAVEDVIISMQKAFNVTRESQISFTKSCVKSVLNMLGDETVEPVDFNSLNDDKIICKVWWHCIGSEPDHNRIKLLKNFNVQIDRQLTIKRATAIKEDRLWV